MKTKFFGGPLATVKAQRYCSICSPGSPVSSTEPVIPMPTPGTFRNLYVKLASDPDSAGSSIGYKFILRKNASNQTLTVTIASNTASFQAVDISNSFAVVAGDLVSLSVNQDGGTPANTPNFSYIVEFEGSNAGETVLMAGVTANIASVTTFLPLAGGPMNGTEGLTHLVFPCPGTITKFMVNLPTAAGGANSRTFTLRLNASSDVGTGITYTSTTNGIQSNTPSIAIVAGDRINVRHDFATTPAASLAGWSIVFVPTTDGNFVIPLASVVSQLVTGAIRFVPVAFSVPTVTATEANVQAIGYSDYTLKGWTAWPDAQPGASKQYLIQLRENAGNPSVTYSTAVAGATQVPTTSPSTSFTPTNFALYNTQSNPSSGPAAVRLTISYLGFIAVGTPYTQSMTAVIVAMSAAGTKSSAKPRPAVMSAIIAVCLKASAHAASATIPAVATVSSREIDHEMLARTPAMSTVGLRDMARGIASTIPLLAASTTKATAHSVAAALATASGATSRGILRAIAAVTAVMNAVLAAVFIPAGAASTYTVNAVMIAVRAVSTRATTRASSAAPPALGATTTRSTKHAIAASILTVAATTTRSTKRAVAAVLKTLAGLWAGTGAAGSAYTQSIGASMATMRAGIVKGTGKVAAGTSRAFTGSGARATQLLRSAATVGMRAVRSKAYGKFQDATTAPPSVSTGKAITRRFDAVLAWFTSLFIPFLPPDPPPTPVIPPKVEVPAEFADPITMTGEADLIQALPAEFDNPNAIRGEY